MSSRSLRESKQELQAPEGAEPTRPRKIFIPRADIIETPDTLTVVVDMPGVDEKSVDVTVEKNILTLHGTVAGEAPAGYTLSYAEYEMGDWHREFVLSDEVKRDGIQAAVKNGVLRLTLPKAEPARKIQVRVE
jgi:HSP20 family molecular chaperone IbpA